MMFNAPAPAPSRVDDVFHTISWDRAWSFTREYPNISPDSLFNALSKSLQGFSSFKVWKVDNERRYIDLTSHSIRLEPGVDHHQVQADVKVLEGKDPSSSAVIIRITPTLIGVASMYEVATNVDIDDKFAKYVANLILGAVEEGYRES
jgi:hypothetical protein